MTCPECGGDRRRLAVPDALAAHDPGYGDAFVVCTTCLRTWPAADVDAPEAAAGELSGALPGSDEAAVALVLAVSLLDAVARNEAALADLFAAVERAGADPRLALERLADDPDVDPAVDVRRRLRQFEGLR